MTRVTSIKDIGLVYQTMLQESQKPAEIVEEKTTKKLNTFPLAKDKKIDTKKILAKGSDKNAFTFKNTGPEAAEGFSKDIVDPKTAKKDNHFEPQKFSTALEKKEPANINNNMSKSIFDKLYEDVMKDDAIDLGIEAGPEGEAGDKASNVDTGSEDVTLTLSRDVAQKLHDLLSDVLGGGVEDEGGSEGDVEEDELVDFLLVVYLDGIDGIADVGRIFEPDCLAESAARIEKAGHHSCQQHVMAAKFFSSCMPKR